MSLGEAARLVRVLLKWVAGPGEAALWILQPHRPTLVIKKTHKGILTIVRSLGSIFNMCWINQK